MYVCNSNIIVILTYHIASRSAAFLVPIVWAAGAELTVHIMTSAGGEGVRAVLYEAAVGDVLRPEARTRGCELCQCRPGNSAARWIDYDLDINSVKCILYCTCYNHWNLHTAKFLQTSEDDKDFYLLDVHSRRNLATSYKLQRYGKVLRGSIQEFHSPELGETESTISLTHWSVTYKQPERSSFSRQENSIPELQNAEWQTLVYDRSSSRKFCVIWTKNSVLLF